MARRISHELLQHFHDIPLFSDVSRKGLRALVSAATEIDVAAGKVLVREGGFDRDLFVITRGEATVTRNRRRLTTLRPGDFFGEMAFLDRAPRTATVTAVTDMSVMVLGPREMEVVYQREPSIATHMLASMARRIRQNERSLQA